MRVLFTAHGAYGHVVPLLGVATALARSGHDVRVATAPGFGDVVSRCGLAVEPAGTDDIAVVAEARRRWPETESAPPASWTTRMFCEIAAPAMVADLARVIDRWRPHVIVREEGEHGGPVAAAAAGLPWVTHGWGSPLPPAEAVTTLARLLRPLWGSAGLEPPDGDGLYGAAVLDPCPPSLYTASTPVAGRCPVRPAPLQGGNGPPLQLSATGRVAYVGFGTVPLFRDAPDLTGVVVDALLGAGFEVVVTTPNAGMARDRVEVEEWVDLPALLPRCSLVVCHGGAGTVLAALAAGVPLVLLPRGAPSQSRMSEACEARGVARAVAWNGTNANDVAAAIVEVASTDRFAAAARAVAEEIASMPDPSTAVTILERVAFGT